MKSFRFVRLLALAALASSLTACVSFSQINSGPVTVGDRMSVTANGAWNQFESRGMGCKPVWTREGLTIDTLCFFVGVKDGELLVANSGNKADRPLAFRAGMQPEEIASLFGAYYSRGGSSFDLEGMRPMDFLGVPGIRFEFSSVRKLDEVRLKGVVWAAVKDKELFAISFTAPRLGFYGRELPQAEAVASSARLLK